MDALVAHEQAERAARESYGVLLARLASRYGFQAAEDVLADAFASALEHWSRDGVPGNPEGWLLTVARNRFVDTVRRDSRAQPMELPDVAWSGERQDERIGMLFACAHPAIAQPVRAPLMLQVVLGLDAARIASAFLVSPSAMSQRLVRAKKKIVEAGVPLRVPDEDAYPSRLTAVLDAIYAAFTEGWGDPAQLDPRNRGLAREAIWLGRLVAECCPQEAEALGLLSLMLHAHSRERARRAPDGSYVPLDAQDPAQWNVTMIEEAESLLERAAAFKRIGRFQLEAAIQSAYAVRRAGYQPDDRAIVVLYDALLAATGSPVVALNRAIVVARCGDAETALRLLETPELRTALQDYQPYWVARADMFQRCGRSEDARAAFNLALGLTVDPAIRAHVLARRDATSDRIAP
jgi:RNA polymerase sigma-70 factor, ECF subfamily